MRNIVIALVVFVSSQGVAEAIREQSVFRDMRLVLSLYDDGTNPLLEMDAPKVGQTFTIYMYVPEASGMRTAGFEVGFGFLSTLRMYQFMVILYGEAYDGSALYAGEEYPTVTALLLSQPAIPASGYIGSVTFKILKDLPEGDRWILAWNASMGDPETNQKDGLDVVGASLTLTGTLRYVVASIPGDLDLDGDVDFSDFLIFTGNFGRTGEPPARPEPVVEYITITDTVYVDRGTADTPQLARARAMLGFWHFAHGITAQAEGVFRRHFLFGDIYRPEDWTSDSEYVVIGVAPDASLAAVLYRPQLERYQLIYETKDIASATIEYNMFFRLDQSGHFLDGDSFVIRGDDDRDQFPITNDSGKGMHDEAGWLLFLGNSVSTQTPRIHDALDSRTYERLRRSLQE